MKRKYIVIFVLFKHYDESALQPLALNPNL